jgi:hypothetical protein
MSAVALTLGFPAFAGTTYHSLLVVMAGLVPAIHVFPVRRE